MINALDYKTLSLDLDLDLDVLISCKTYLDDEHYLLLEINEGEIFERFENFKSKTVQLRFCYNLKYMNIIVPGLFEPKSVNI